jgi:hypothetical protein
MGKKLNPWTLGPMLGVLAVVVVGVCVGLFHDGQSSKGEAAPSLAPSSKDPLRESSRAAAKHSKGERDKSVGSDLTPQLAKSRIEEHFAKTPDLGERSKLACELIMQLCENGFSSEAFLLLDENFGTVRQNELRTLFAYARLSNEELLARIDEVAAYQGDKRTAMKGYLNRFRVDELAETVSDPNFQGMLSRGNKLSSYTLSAALAGALQLSPLNQDGESKTRFLETSKELIEKGFLKPADLLAITDKSLAEDPIERWELIQKAIPSGSLIIDDDEGANSGEALIAQMVTSDGPKALGNLLKIGDYRSVNHAIAQWTHSDPSGATKWYEGNAGRLSPDQNNAVSSAFASTALRSAEFDSARAWAGKIQDPKSKEDLLGKIAGAEQKKLDDVAAMEKGKQDKAGK